MRYSEVERLVWEEARKRFPNSPQDQANFVAFVAQESGFNPQAHATQGGDFQGLFQFGHDLRSHYGVDMNSPPEQQISAGSDYINQLYIKHKGDWDKITAEFNLGEPMYRRYTAGEKFPQGERFRAAYLPLHQKTARKYGAPGEQPGEAYASAPQASPTPQTQSDTQSGTQGWKVSDAWTPKTPAEDYSLNVPPPRPPKQFAGSFMDRLKAMTPEDKFRMGQLAGLLISGIAR